MRWIVGFGKGKTVIEADSKDQAEIEAVRRGINCDEARPEDFYDRIGDCVRRAKLRWKLQRVKARSNAESKAIARSREVEILNTRVQRAAERDDLVNLGGGEFLPVAAIQSVEPSVNQSLFLSLAGVEKYGWKINCFQREPITVRFSRAEAAEQYLQYLRSKIPSLQVLHPPKDVVFWWVSF